MNYIISAMWAESQDMEAGTVCFVCDLENAGKFGEYLLSLPEGYTDPDRNEESRNAVPQDFSTLLLSAPEVEYPCTAIGKIDLVFTYNGYLTYAAVYTEESQEP